VHYALQRGRRKIRKACVIIGLILLTLGIVLAYSFAESSPEQITLDKWNPVTPTTLSAQNQTGWDFTALTQGGSFLKLNVTASDNVALMIGQLTYNNVTGDQTWNNLIFNQVGTRFAQDVSINGTGASFLEIVNNATAPVNLSGNVTKIGTVNQTVYPYSLLGTLLALAGFILLIYGIVTRPGPGRKHSKKKTVKTWRPST
jgi:uncharacterized membrane protein